MEQKKARVEETIGLQARVRVQEIGCFWLRGEGYATTGQLTDPEYAETVEVSGTR